MLISAPMRGLICLGFALLAACASGEPGKPEPVAKTGKAGQALVPGAVKARSAKYKLVGTVTVGNGWTSSPEHTKHGGIVGATQP